jgi:hypothetical protein
VIKKERIWYFWWRRRRRRRRGRIIRKSNVLRNTEGLGAYSSVREGERTRGNREADRG